ncbi:hypothetical protein JCM6292_2567 [Bacteroides pyogenes JCM 6292]|uniref:Uncharacterized protein n=1 Tax=Bacteroides pyogenes JCM 6292 TaxID=1235809 RepID=W4P8W7_9BACE|nr:hypothetical protein JCM6292_2567 [Bacteroides pyogenes JCM 6292]
MHNSLHNRHRKGVLILLRTNAIESMCRILLCMNVGEACVKGKFSIPSLLLLSAFPR